MSLAPAPSGQRLDRLYSPPEIGAPGKRRARAQRRDLLYAGIFVLAMIAVVLATLALLLPGLFRGVYRVQAYFPDAQGLDPGIQVIQEGYVVGLVEQVVPVFPGRDDAARHCPAASLGAPPRHPALPCFRATLRLKNDWPVPADSVAQLGAAGFLKGDVIKVQPGRSPELLADGGVIAAQSREADLAAQVGLLVTTLQTLVKETIAPALDSIRDQIQTIETLIGTGGDQSANRDRLASAFESLQQLSANLEQAIDPAAVAAILGSVREMSGHMATITRDMTASTQDIQRAVVNYDRLATDIRGLVRDNRPALQNTLDDTQFLLQEISSALTPILTNIEDATRNLSALLRDLRNDPMALLKGREAEDKTPWFP